MKAELLKLLRTRISISDSHLNRKVFVFLVCLLISFFTWLQINLSKEHTDMLPVRLNYVNTPRKWNVTLLPDTLLVEVETNGYGLLDYEMKDVSIDFKRLKRDESGRYFFLPNNLTKTISKQMGDNLKVIRAITDTVRVYAR